MYVAYFSLRFQLGSVKFYKQNYKIYHLNILDLQVHFAHYQDYHGLNETYLTHFFDLER